ncbi:uncharacterized protein LOC125185221 isoform X2 [Salvia hispanica]|uniref:uncharacterized protein LOC125185221 isoform X2 n=1 Tax=Salvia hispanica TaxID=49212 RepID=UPI002008F03D|nr:uncharacterized protein LOC125185221 isoform X2 [Salvia hispanica]
MSSVSRRTKWHPAPPSPKILHFPRRCRTRARKSQSSKPNLEREGFEEHRHGFAAEEWLFQLERPGRNKMVESKRNAVLEDEIQDLTHKLRELHFNLRIKGSTNFDNNLQQLSNTNILKEATLSDSTNHDAMKEQEQEEEDEARQQENKCSGRCKAMVLRIMEQVRAETEQWSQMQTMLEQVRGEMEQLQASRDYWENRAYTSEFQIQSLRHSVEEWKQKALDYEKEVHELENKVSMNDTKRGAPLLSLAKQLAKEKRSFLKEKASRRHSSIFGASEYRSPLREIGNSRQNHRAAFDYHSPERSRIRESFRK